MRRYISCRWLPAVRILSHNHQYNTFARRFHTYYSNIDDRRIIQSRSIRRTWLVHDLIERRLTSSTKYWIHYQRLYDNSACWMTFSWNLSVMLIRSISVIEIDGEFKLEFVAMISTNHYIYVNNWIRNPSSWAMPIRLFMFEAWSWNLKGNFMFKVQF